MKEVRLGIVGVGAMGTSHARQVLDGRINRCRLTAACDIDAQRLRQFEAEGVTCFDDHRRLLEQGVVDAVLIATPHFDHTTIGIDVLQHGLHLLVEKPISAHKADCEKLIAAHRGDDRVFAAMFNQRTDPRYRAVKRLIDDGDLGNLVRVNWIITDWFRTEIYYAGGGWRATWAGEGGGVLLNQSPHQLDLLQWLCGMPRRVRGFCALGKYHDIEVEDDVTAYLEYDHGATGVFITTTGEAPGTNRLEICGQRGKVVVEDDDVRFWRNATPANEFSRTTDLAFGKPEVEVVPLAVDGRGGQHVEIMQNFVDAILDGAPLIAPAAEGIHSVELANAILMSSLRNESIELPLDGDTYADLLKERIRASAGRQKTVRRPRASEDISASS